MPTTNKQKPSLDTLKEIRGTVWQKLCHQLPRYYSLGPRKFFLNPIVYPVKGEGEHVSKHPTSWTVWEATERVHFSLAPPRVLNPELHGGRGEGGGLALAGERWGVWKSSREASFEQRNDMTTKKKLTVGKRTEERSEVATARISRPQLFVACSIMVAVVMVRDGQFLDTLWRQC